MILEGIVTTLNADGSLNIAPQGPIIAPDWSQLTFRPFPASQTFANLSRDRCGVFHVVDDVLLLAQTALDLHHAEPPTLPAPHIPGHILADCCRWYEFRIHSIDLTGERPLFEAVPVHGESVRDHFGFNRAKHAVIEATIAATRLHLLDHAAVLEELARLRVPIIKTGGPRELEAFRLVEAFVQAACQTRGGWSPEPDASPGGGETRAELADLQE